MKDLSSHMMDIVQNSIRAEASWIQIRICEDPEADLFLIEIQDNGCGMDVRLWQGSGILFLPAGQYAKWAWEFPCSSKMPNEPEEKLVSSHSRVKGLLSQPVSVIPIWTVLLWEM